MIELNQIGRISNFGLLEMSRQRLRESSVKWSIKLTNESFVLKILKMVEIKTIELNAKIVDLQISEKIYSFIDEHFKNDLNYFEKKNKVKININSNDKLNLSEYFIEYKSKSKKIIEKAENFESLKKISTEKKNNKDQVSRKKKFIKKKRSKKKFTIKKN